MPASRPDRRGGAAGLAVIAGMEKMGFASRMSMA
jgi:hypothetical protein